MRHSRMKMVRRRFSIMPHTLFISDLHLSADHPHSIAAFQRFIATLAPQAEALYILGDLFEYWAGDDDLARSFSRAGNQRIA